MIYYPYFILISNIYGAHVDASNFTIFTYSIVNTCFNLKYDTYSCTRSVNNIQRKLGSNLPSYGPKELLHYTQWRVACELTSYNNGKCEATLNEWWCVSWHYIAMRSVRLHSMNGGVWIVLGGKTEHETLGFPCKVASAGDGSYLMCATGAAAVISIAK